MLGRQWLQNTNGSVIILKDAVNTAKLRAARTAVAIERYRLAHGQLPTTLPALVPFYLETAPSDPFDGQPLRYQKLANGYVVYSVGTDVTNDKSDNEKHITFTVER